MNLEVLATHCATQHSILSMRECVYAEGADLSAGEYTTFRRELLASLSIIREHTAKSFGAIVSMQMPLPGALYAIFPQQYAFTGAKVGNCTIIHQIDDPTCPADSTREQFVHVLDSFIEFYNEWFMVWLRDDTSYKSRSASVRRLREHIEGKLLFLNISTNVSRCPGIFVFTRKEACGLQLARRRSISEFV